MTQKNELYCLRSNLAVAFKTPPGADYGAFQGTYGAGFNAQLEVAWTWTAGRDVSKLDTEFRAFVKIVDHRHLGMDAPELGISTPETLLKLAADHFEKLKIPASSVRLTRGEDVEYRLELNPVAPIEVYKN
jgi:hypothetical protein